MRFLSLLLFGLSLLTVALVLLGLWLDSSPVELMRQVRALLHEDRRRLALEHQDRAVVQRLEERAQVMAAIEAGTMSLFEAAKCFEHIGLSEKAALDFRIPELPNDEAGWCRKVLRSMHAQLGPHPSRLARVLPPLVQAYQERFGQLPAALEQELRRSNKMALDR